MKLHDHIFLRKFQLRRVASVACRLWRYALTENCKEPTYIIHVKQTLAVTNCWTRNKIVYLLQKQNRKSWRLWLKRELERVLDIGKTETVWCMSKIKGYPPPSYYCIFCEIKLLNFVRILNSWWTIEEEKFTIEVRIGINLGDRVQLLWSNKI